MICIFSEDRESILLHLRDDADLWSVPGGSAEFGESLEELVKREAFEEVGLEIAIDRVFGIYSSPTDFIFKYRDGNEVHSYVVGVECRKISGFEQSNSDDSLEVRWFKVNNLPDNLMKNQYQVINDCLSGGFSVK